MLISWSNRPARRRAASNESGRLVAPITMTGLFSVFSHDISTLVRSKDEDKKGDIEITIHARQELCNYTPFHLSLGALSFWSYRIDLIDEK